MAPERGLCFAHMKSPACNRLDMDFDMPMSDSFGGIETVSSCDRLR